jgi:hypothetical protein
MLQQPDVSGLADPRSEDDEIQHSHNTALMEYGAMILARD